MKKPFVSRLYGFAHSLLPIAIFVFAVGVCTSARSDGEARLPNLVSTVIQHQYPKSFRDLGEIVKFGRGGSSTKFVPVDRSVDPKVRAHAEATARKWLQSHCPAEWAKQLTVSKIEIAESDHGIFLLTFLPAHNGIAIEQKNWVEIDRGEVTYAFLQVNKIVPTSQKAQETVKRSDAFQKIAKESVALGWPVKFDEKGLKLIYRQCPILHNGKPRLQFTPVWVDPQDYIYINAHTGECRIND